MTPDTMRYIQDSVAARENIVRPTAPATTSLLPAKPWYENPWYLGLGSITILAGVWFFSRRR